MELKLSDRKRFFVRLSNDIKDDLSYLKTDGVEFASARKGKVCYKESAASSCDIEDYIVDENNVLTFSKEKTIVKKFV